MNPIFRLPRCCIVIILITCFRIFADVSVPDTIPPDFVSADSVPVHTLPVSEDPSDSVFAEPSSYDSIAAPVSVEKTEHRAQSRLIPGVGAGLSWNILVVPEIDSWRDIILHRINHPLDSTAKYRIDRPFNSFNNTFTPAVKLLWEPSSRLGLELDVQYFRLRKNIIYSDTAAGTLWEDQSRAETLLLQATPVSFSIRAYTDEKLFKVNQYHGFYGSAGIALVPWTKITAVGDLQQNVWGIGKAVGFVLKAGVRKWAMPHIDTYGEISYSHLPVKRFDRSAITLTKNAMNLNGAGDFILSQGSLQFCLYFIYHGMEKSEPDNTPSD